MHTHMRIMRFLIDLLITKKNRFFNAVVEWKSSTSYTYSFVVR